MPENKESIDQLFQVKEFPVDAFFIGNELSNKQIVLYGAGESSHWFIEIVMKIHGFKPSIVLDKKFKCGDTYEGIPAFSPNDFQATKGQQEDALVVICTGNQQYHQEILTYLEAVGFQNIIFLKDIYEIHNPFSQPRELFEKGFSYYLEQKANILSAFDLFDDLLSQEVYRCFLQTHMQRKPVLIPESPRNEQYFPKDIDLSKGYARYITCGAYDGDTIRLLHRTHGAVEDIVCFEAEPTIFKRLAGFIEGSPEFFADNILAYPYAVYSHEAIVPFTKATGLGSRISEDGDSEVECVALDHLLPDFKPTFISMDIEGAEPQALKGAESMIRQHQPDLAICVYHSPNHLWEIPLYLHSLGLGYRFYLRNYTSFTIETVLYATV